MAKRAEQEFKSMCTRYNIWAHKWRDVTMCPHCYKPIFMTKRQNGSSEAIHHIVDYLIFIEHVPAWIECKEGKKSFSFNSFPDKQRKFMKSWEDKGVLGFVFLLMGEGRAPKDRSAYMIPWPVFEIMLQVSEGQDKSWCYKEIKGRTSTMSTEALFGKYHLNFEGGWRIPPLHYFANIYLKYDIDVLNLDPLKTQ